MKKQNLMAGLCLSLATTFVAFAALLMPMVMNLAFNSTGSGAIQPKGIIYMIAYGCLLIFGIVYTIMSIISICKLRKDDATVAKKKGLFIATLVFQAILVVAGIVALINGFEAIAEIKSLASSSEEVMPLLMQYGATNYIVIMCALITNITGFVVNLVSVCKLKKPVAVVAE